jgi:predicted nucleic acid-binding protein
MIFVDTWAWIALVDKTDQYYAAAQRQHDQHIASRERYVTSDFMLTEFINYLHTSFDSDDAQVTVELMFEQAAGGALELIHVSPDQFLRAWQLRKKYRDKSDISFIDFTSFVVMRDLGITDVFTGDAHFQQVGMGFRLVP